MISRIRGKLLRREMDFIEVMTASGLAYRVEIPLTVFERLPKESDDIELRTQQIVREDSVALYGFLEEGERQVFTRLLEASGFGPKLALDMLSSMPADRLVRAISERDVTALRQIPGIGKKKAERLGVELGDKMEDLAAVAAAPGAPGALAEQAVGALVALGYSQSEANSAVRQALDGSPELEGPQLIKAALARLGK